MTRKLATGCDGTRHDLDGQEPRSLMEILPAAGLSIEIPCSGSRPCATGHVFVEQPWLGMLKPQTDFEPATLEGEGGELRPNSRLSRQLGWRNELHGIVLTVAPEL